MPYAFCELIGKEIRDISDEIPFEIPESWEWVRLGSIVYNRGQMKPTSDFCYVDIGSIDNKRQRLGDTENIITPDKAPSRARKIIGVGDIIYSTVRPYLHNMCIIDRQFSLQPIASTGFATMTCYSGLLNKYLFYYLLAPDFDNYANDTENSKGVAYPAINDDRLYKALIPIPPLAEQHRIVAKIEELLPHIERYGKAEEHLTALNTTFPEALKKSILQEAVQGKLVPQNSDDEPASVLLERIRAEKQALIKAGKIKKDKHESVIVTRDKIPYEIIDGKERCIADEVPFELPEGWEWSSINELFFVTKLAGFEYTKYFSKNNIRAEYSVHIVRAKNVKMGQFIENENEAITDDLSVLLNRSALTQDCLLMTFIGAGIGDTCIYHSDKRHHLAPNVAKIEPQTSGILLQYYLIWLMSPEGQKSVEQIKKTTAQPSLSMETIRSIRVAIPPFDEQKRIVSKIEELIPIISTI